MHSNFPPSFSVSPLLPLFQGGAAATRVRVGRVPTLISTGVLLGVSSSAPAAPPHPSGLTLPFFPSPFPLSLLNYHSCPSLELLLPSHSFMETNDVSQIYCNTTKQRVKRNNSINVLLKKLNELLSIGGYFKDLLVFFLFQTF